MVRAATRRILPSRFAPNLIQQFGKTWATNPMHANVRVVLGEGAKGADL